ncbi:hypothetical protein E1B28_000868 [Marasmius oreades]|uniref:Uncharacterized protein n=1 Tax=Marasmius oreades TaxID=181124 RepID=A0A9P8AET6_9AGAR|nr:uncharacterized protein E1B28_000868 [Marasmius oreades]KAG7098982.1 hypothetical protein E1B28_000868 [Marasmius oreades]
MSTLERCPVEVLEEIASWIRGDLRNFRLVSKYINQAAQRVFWATHTLVIDIGPVDTIKTTQGRRCAVLDVTKFNAALMLLRELNSQTPSSKFIQNLEIKLGPWGTLAQPLNSDVQKLSRETLPNLLPAALSALQGLVSVRLHVMITNDPDWFHRLIFQPLANLPLLSDLTLEDHSYHTLYQKSQRCIPLHFFNTGRLRKLIVIGRSLSGDKFLSSISDLLIHNPHIIHLKLDDFSSIGGRNVALGDLFRSTKHQLLPLKTLHLHGWFADFSDPDLLAHIRTLSSLELCGHFADYPGVWKVFLRENIILRNISCHSVKDELMSYLDSFSGLEKLSAPYNGLSDDNQRVDIFYRRTLHNHRESLQEVHVGSVYEGPWTIGLQNVDIFDGFEKLVFVSVSLKWEDVHFGVDERDVVVSNLPNQW